MRNNGVDCAHLQRAVCVVLTSQKEDLPSKLLADLLGKIRRAIARIEGAHIGIGLFEPCVLGTGDTEITHDVETVSPTGSPARNSGDDDFGHKANESLHLKNVQAAAARRVNTRGIVGI